MINLSVLRAVCLALVLSTGTTGCASSIATWIVNTRNAQGDNALAHGTLQDASAAYKLALQVDPANVHARAGLTAVQLEIAAQAYRDSKFVDALEALAIAAKYDPQSVRLQQLRSDVEQARLRQEIVLSNYPSYRETNLQIRREYRALDRNVAKILEYLKAFGYSFDTAQLTKAIDGSYELNADIARVTNRLISYRQLVESGSPESEKRTGTLAPAASLLPLP